MQPNATLAPALNNASGGRGQSGTNYPQPAKLSEMRGEVHFITCFKEENVNSKTLISF